MSAERQHPIGSGFGAKSTADEVLAGMDLNGMNVVVTGGYSGIGLETVRALSKAGAEVTVPARRSGEARRIFAAESIAAKVVDMDLADIASIQRFASRFGDKPLHVLINNAGIMACPETRIGPGWEAQLGVNHLGHMALFMHLLPALKAANGARVVALSSAAHAMADIQWHDMMFVSNDYDKWQAYGQAKTANALFAIGVDNNFAAESIRGYSVHPGGIFTPLQRHLPEEEMVALGWKNADGTIPDRIRELFKTPEQGAATAVWAATSQQLQGKGGVYCEDVDIAHVADASSQPGQHVQTWACDDAAAERLWAVSVNLLSEAT